MDGFGLALGLARGVQVAATLSLFGTLGLTVAVARPAAARAPPDAAAALQRRLLGLVKTSLLAALLAALAWLPLQSADFADGADLPAALGALPAVAFETRFGHALLLRLALLLLAGGLAVRGRAAAALLPAGIAVAAQSWMGHPAASEDRLLLAASILHVLAAGAWLGGLVPLYLTVRALPGRGAARAAGRFAWIGFPAVLVLAGTAFWQGFRLIGDEGALFGTTYGQLALFKLALFAGLLGFAAVNRFRLTPALREEAAAQAGRHLLTSIVLETALGLAVVLAAGLLATLTPAAHAQPLWPFPLRPNLALLADRDVRDAFIEAALLGVVAVGLLGRACLFRRLRWAALAAAAGLLYYANHVIDAAPFLDPILIEAFPTAYYHSPTGFTAASVANGAQLFAANCVACHGREGRGDGVAAKLLPVRPANLTQEHVWGHSDGELFWRISHGFVDRRYGRVMPGFADVLSEDDRWALIDFIHARLVGVAMAAQGRSKAPLAPPALAASCGDGSSLDLEGLRGRFVRIIAARPGEEPPPAAAAIPTIRLLEEPGEAPGCVASGPEVWTAYAVVAGVAPEALAGTQFLVDPAGWLRLSLKPSQAAAWASEAGLAAAMQDLAAHPLAAGAAVHHHH
jgi:putative copper export protein/mono/diheme cytochrome c family protein